MPEAIVHINIIAKVVLILNHRITRLKEKYIFGVEQLTCIMKERKKSNIGEKLAH